jgi:alpha-1,6-mannosyltransferase
MKIVDVCAFYAPAGGGVRTYVERKLASAPALGHELVVIVPGSERSEVRRSATTRMVTLPAPHFPLDRRYRYFDDEAALHALLDREQPDVVEVASQWRSCTMVERWRGNARRVLFLHSEFLAAFAYRWLGAVAPREQIDGVFDWYWRHLRSVSQSFDCIVSASPGLTQRLASHGVGKLATIPMGVEAGIFSPSWRREALRSALLERCSLAPDARLLLAAGRMAPEKRWPMVIEAVTAAGQRRPLGLVLVGDGRARTRIARLAAANPHVHLLAPVRDRQAFAQLLASADALIHGCEAETFCLVAAEARASGLSLIVPDAGGAADQYRPGVDQKYATASASAAAAAITRWAERPPTASAIAAAADVRTMDDHFVELFALYEGLANGLRSAA